jgi:hypothetical protein
MSGVNNDTGAAAVASLYLWATIRLLRRGPSVPRVAAVALLALACLAVKSTAGLVAVTGLLVLATAWLHRRRWWLPWALAGLILISMALAALDWQHYAAGWYDARQGGAPQRQRNETPVGEFALVLSSSGVEHPAALVQELPPARGGSLAGQTVTLGAWLRGAGEEQQRAELRLRDGTGSQVFQVALTAEWQFTAFTAQVAPGSATVEVWVAVPAGEPADLPVYADGLILVPGALNPGAVPQFTGSGARRATWDGQEVVNLLRNGSAETTWPGLKPWLRSARLYRTGAQEVLHSILDWQRTGWVYQPELMLLLRSFWGRFGWGHLVLPEPWFYPLILLTLAAAVGAILALVRRVRRAAAVPGWKRRALWLLGLSLLVASAGAMLRIHPVDVLGYTFWPSARYLTVAIGPLSIALCAGLAELVPSRWQAVAAGAGVVGLVTLEWAALWTVILPYYYG